MFEDTNQVEYTMFFDILSLTLAKLVCKFDTFSFQNIEEEFFVILANGSKAAQLFSNAIT